MPDSSISRIMASSRRWRRASAGVAPLGGTHALSIARSSSSLSGSTTRSSNFGDFTPRNGSVGSRSPRPARRRTVVRRTDERGPLLRPRPSRAAKRSRCGGWHESLGRQRARHAKRGIGARPRRTTTASVGFCVVPSERAATTAKGARCRQRSCSRHAVHPNIWTRSAVRVQRVATSSPERAPDLHRNRFDQQRLSPGSRAAPGSGSGAGASTSSSTRSDGSARA